MLKSSLMDSEDMMIGTITDKLGHSAGFASQNYPDTLRHLWTVLNDYEVSTCNTNFQADSKHVLFVNSDIILHNFS